MLRKLIFFIVLFLPLVCEAQVQTTISGILQGPTGAPATSGYVEFRLQPSSSSILYRIPGSTVLVPQTARCGVDGSGNLKNTALSGNCQVWGNDLISPANSTYTVAFAPGNTVGVISTQWLISGTTYSINNPVFTPSVIVRPDQTTITTQAIQSNLLPITTNALTLGSSNLRWEAFIDTLNVNNIQGLISFTTGQLTFTGSSGVATSATGQGRIYFDSNSNTFQYSENGGSFRGLSPGSGITGAVPIWTSSTQLGSSDLTKSGTMYTLADNLTVVGGSTVTGNLAITGASSLTGNVTLGGSLSQGVNFTVDSSGNITHIRGIGYSFPFFQGVAGSLLQNDGFGNLLWSTQATPVTGTGTTNAVTRWASSTSLTPASFFDNGTVVYPSGTIDFGSVAAPWQNVWVNDNIVAGIAGGNVGGYFIRVGGVNRGVATPNNATLQIGDATPTWTRISFFPATTEKLGVHTNGIDIRGVGYVWPSSQGGASTFLENDGAGNLTWSTTGASGITGAGTTNRVAKFTASGTIGNTVFVDNGTDVFPNTDTGPNMGTPSARWNNFYGSGNAVLDGAYFIHNGTNWGVASRSGTTLRFGDATGATWGEIDFFMSSGSAGCTMTNSLLTCAQFSGSGASLTNLPAASVTGLTTNRIPKFSSGLVDSAISDDGTSVLPTSGRDLGSGVSGWTNIWATSNIIAGSGYFLRVGGVNRGVASPSGTTLQVGDASATWTQISLFPGTAGAKFSVTSAGNTYNASGSLYFQTDETGIRSNAGSQAVLVDDSINQVRVFAGGTQTMAITSGSNGVCVKVGGVGHYLSLSGSNFVDGGTCGF